MNILIPLYLLYSIAVRGNSLEMVDEYGEQPMIVAYEGWFLAIPCAVPIVFGTGPEFLPEDDATVQCIIVSNEEVIFNKTIQWSTIFEEGVFTDASESWRDAVIQVNLTWQEGGEQYCNVEVIVGLISHEVSDCSMANEPEYNSIRVGTTTQLDCQATDELLLINEDQYNSISTVWYRGCDRLERNNMHYVYVDGEYDRSLAGDYQRFDSLKIQNASLYLHPGSYHCELELNNTRTRTSEVNLCVQLDFEYNVNPSIIASREQYVAEPSSTVILECTGHTGQNSPTLSQMGVWFKQGDPDFHCAAKPTHPQTEEGFECTYEINEDTCYDQQLTHEEVAEAENKYRNDNFTMTLTLKNIIHDHALKYECKFYSTREIVMAEIELVVRSSPLKQTNILTIALVVVAVFIVIALVGFTLLHFFWIPVRYFLKKSFGRPQESIKKYVAYVLYSWNSSNPEAERPVEEIRKWFQQKNYEFYDPNRCVENGGDAVNNNAGALIDNHFRSTLSQCMRLVIVVTENLLDQNAWELFEVYNGFDQNARRNLRIVFVCSKEIEKEIKKRSARNNTSDKSCVTFHRFMKMQTNCVIRWKENDTKSFYQALYIAIPLLRRRSSDHFYSEVIQNQFALPVGDQRV